MRPGAVIRGFTLVAIGLAAAIVSANGGDIQVFRCAMPPKDAWTDDTASTDDTAAALRECTVLIQSKRYSQANLASLYFQRGDIYLAMHNAKAAIADFTQAIALWPEFIGALRSRADALSLDRNYTDAARDYTAAMTLDPKDSSLAFGRAGVYERAGDIDHAIADYSTAISLDPGVAQYRTERALAYEIKGDLSTRLLTMQR